MPDSPPALFGRVPRGLFGPLGDPYAELYWQLLAELYRYEFEREPFIVVRSTAIEAAESIICASRLWQERREELEALVDDAAATAAAAATRAQAASGGGTSAAARAAAASDAQNANRRAASVSRLKPRTE